MGTHYYIVAATVSPLHRVPESMAYFSSSLSKEGTRSKFFIIMSPPQFHLYTSADLELYSLILSFYLDTTQDKLVMVITTL
jgi:hypothetical protein